MLARCAVELIADGMVVCVGAGSTVDVLVDEIRSYVVEKNIHIKFVSASSELNKFAAGQGISVLEIENVSHIDLLFDGADFVDLESGIVSKGNGGFVFNETYLARLSKSINENSRRILLIDESKLDFSRLPKVFLEVKQSKIAEVFNALGDYTFFVRERLSESGNFVVEIELESGLDWSFEDFIGLEKHVDGVLASGVSKGLYNECYVAYKKSSLFLGGESATVYVKKIKL